MKPEEIENLKIELLSIDDYEEFKEAMIAAYKTLPNSYWPKDKIEKLISIFPEGQVVIKANGRIAACALSIIVDYDSFGDNHTYKQITGDYTFNTHTPYGDILYGIEVFVHPSFRGLRLGRRLYEYRKQLCEKLNLKGVVFGGRIPNYHKWASKYSPKEYLEKVKHREIDDLVLNFQLSNDFYPSRILKNYLEGDFSSGEYAVLLKWDNLYYEEPQKKAKIKKSIVRLGLIQWQMRPYKGMDDLMLQSEYFIDAVSGYKCDFALFPEFFNAPLMAEFNHLPEADAIRSVARYTPEIVQRFSQFAISYNINIIAGSMPEMLGDTLYNVGYLCHRSGKIDRYEKLHVTPDESKVWGLKGGNQIKAFDTDCGKIGVLICYDSEFPELSRLLAEEGMQILFVPFLTDTQNAYSRVRYCAQARAIENECYVAIAGSVGNLPKVHNMDIQYAQSMVFTPCDFAFPANGIKAEATPNTEMILVVDVDLSVLKELNQYGSVRNLRDRRKDIFVLSKK
ncbi:MAG: hypothetical protein PWR03_1804 [Tenuifilum sp.]|jgi:predicted amidohydrolase/GNAT superfamily N-acetyltransferase|uniref:carbon-nitrogen hydrolase family protein n=1 Tax=Tenuifilum sp. TaxID=2760880 RepID=UPI0024AA3A2E|nr:bifunctional GNAT family N-acetyltransferase/carbon-nitrogen hydrolase family protein [Tenuifilum sp.]MDI3527621.1 hypothetical protein [Tenuifilum sp.]